MKTQKMMNALKAFEAKIENNHWGSTPFGRVTQGTG